MPDLAGSQVAFYLNVKQMGELGQEAPVGGLTAIGLTARARGDTATMHLRAVVA